MQVVKRSVTESVNDPPRSEANIRVTYYYDAAGSGGGREILRTEQTYSGGWVNNNKVKSCWVLCE